VIVVVVTFVALLAAAGVRAAPGVLMLPLSVHFGWDRATVSLTGAVGILLFGLTGPFAAALMQSIGIRRTMLGGLALMGAATLASLWMRDSWHYLLTWGVLSGIGSGAVAPVLAAAVVNRWFAVRRGLVMGLFSASTATGALVFLPVLAWLSEGGAWRPVVETVGIVCLVLVLLVAVFMPERPADVGTTRLGEDAGAAAKSPDTAPLAALPMLAVAARRPIFWLLFGSFLVCGFTTNGLIGMHMIAYCGDHGVAPVAAAGLLTVMGVFDLIGTTASGWLTDRYDPKRLLVGYYALRGASLLLLPTIDFGGVGMAVFAVVYGLNWIATVPPTLALTNRAFGDRAAPIVFGWIVVGHQIGAALAAYTAGIVREVAGSYAPAFIGSGVFALIAAAAVLALPSLRQDGEHPVHPLSAN
jgi:MFS family permease